MRDGLWALLLLVILAGVGLTAGVTFLVDEPATAAGLAHPEFDSLLIGGPTTRYEAVMPACWVLGTLILAFMVALMAFAYRGDGRLRAMGPWLVAALVIETAIFTAVVIAYERQLAAPAPAMVLGFPPATAWLLYGLWPSNLIFVAIFVVTFRTAYWRPVDEARFRALLDRQGE